jgi:hypothetical protein
VAIMLTALLGTTAVAACILLTLVLFRSLVTHPSTDPCIISMSSQYKALSPVLTAQLRLGLNQSSA